MSRVFISYTHDNDEHTKRVRALGTKLRRDGIDLVVDADKEPAGPDEGWPAWSEKQAASADLLLLVVTRSFERCWNGEAPAGMRLGATHEIKVIRNRIYDAGYYTSFCRVLLVNAADAQYVPLVLKGLQTFDSNDTQSYEGLLAWLRGALAPPAADAAAPGTAPSGWSPARPGFEWTLADRTQQFTTYQQMITGTTAERALLVRGAGNCGKTVLLAQFLSYAQHQGLMRVLVDLKGCPALDDVFRNLLELGAARLPRAAQSSPAERGYWLLQDFETSAAPVVLIFDVYEKAPEPVRDWIEGRLLVRLGSFAHVVIVIAGREIPDVSRQTSSNLSVSADLAPIVDVNSWLDWNRRLGKCLNLTADHVEAFMAIFKGDPGLLSASIETLGLRYRAAEA